MVDLGDLSKRFVAAQLRGDRREALRLVLEDGLGAGASVPELHLKVVQSAQYEIGRLWQANRISVAEEHLATAIAVLALGRLYPHLPYGEPNGKRVMLACVEGERHEMGARIASDFLEMAGFAVTYLGADVPTDDLLKQVRDERPDLLALSVAIAHNLPSVREVVARVRSVAPELPIIAGGHAFSWAPGVEELFGIDGTGRDAEELVAVSRRLTGLA